MLFTFENGVPLMRQGASVVRHHSLLLMNGFNKTEAVVFSCRLCFLRAFPLISSIIATLPFAYSVKCIYRRIKLVFAFSHFFLQLTYQGNVFRRRYYVSETCFQFRVSSRQRYLYEQTLFKQRHLGALYRHFVFPCGSPSRHCGQAVGIYRKT